MEQQRRQCTTLEERVGEGGKVSGGARARREDVGTEVKVLRKELTNQVREGHWL